MKNYRQARIIKQDTGDGLKNAFIINNNGSTRAVITWNMQELRSRVDHLIDDLNCDVIDGVIQVDADLTEYWWLTRVIDLTQPVSMW